MILNPEHIDAPHNKPSHIPKYVGPYYVVKRLHHGAYILRDEVGEQLDRAVTLDQLKVLKRFPRKYTSLSDDETRFYVERIEDERDRDGRTEYFVKWKGYTRNDNTWETVDAFDDPETIAQWNRLKQARQAGASASRKGKKRRVNTVIITHTPSINTVNDALLHHCMSFQ